MPPKCVQPKIQDRAQSQNQDQDQLDRIEQGQRLKVGGHIQEQSRVRAMSQPFRQNDGHRNFEGHLNQNQTQIVGYSSRNSTPVNETNPQIPLFSRVNRSVIHNRYVDVNAIQRNTDHPIIRDSQVESTLGNLRVDPISERQGHLNNNHQPMNFGIVNQDRLHQLQRNVFQNERIREEQGAQDNVSVAGSLHDVPDDVSVAGSLPGTPRYEPEVDFRRRLRSEVRILIRKLFRTVETIESNIEEIQRVLSSKQYELSDICFRSTNLQGLLNLLSDLVNHAKPYTQLDDEINTAEVVFEISVRRPEWEGVLSSLDTIKSDMERIKNPVFVQQQSKEQITKAVKVSYSEFPRFDGKGKYQDWWARWKQLADSSQLDKINLTIKLRESITGMAEELIGTTLMSTGSFDQILEKLKSIYYSPIEMRQSTAIEFFNIGLDSESIIDIRKMVTRGQDVLQRVEQAEMSTESLMTNLLLAYMPERIRDKMVAQLNQTCPSYNMDMITFNNAFTSATQSQKVTSSKVLTVYQNSVSKASESKKKFKRKQHCSFHGRDTHNRGKCSIKTPEEGREYLKRNDRCQACLRPKDTHGENCVGNDYGIYCIHHPNERHHTHTCDGPNFKHPGCQFTRPR